MRATLITGATAGIGYELTKCFAQDGHNLVLVARRAEKLQQIKEEMERRFSVSATIVTADLADPAAPQQIFDTTEQDAIEVEYLVNNAGFGTNGKFHENDLTQELAMIQVNVTALVHLTGLYLPKMVERGRGGVMNVASTAAFQPGPMMAVYCATKAFVLSFSEAIANEVSDAGIKVQALCPGATITEFQDRAGIHEIPLIKSPMSSVMQADEVAKQGYKAFMKGDRVTVTGLFNKLGAFSVRFMPRAVVTQAARMMMDPKKS